jgi:hypothetical protein
MRIFLALDGSCKLISKRGLANGSWVNARQLLRSEPRNLNGRYFVALATSAQSPISNHESASETRGFEVDPAREAAGAAS